MISQPESGRLFGFIIRERFLLGTSATSLLDKDGAHGPPGSRFTAALVISNQASSAASTITVTEWLLRTSQQEFPLPSTAGFSGAPAPPGRSERLAAPFLRMPDRLFGPLESLQCVDCQRGRQEREHN